MSREAEFTAGTFRISRPSGGRSRDEGYVNLVVEDELSGRRVVELEIPLLDLAKALTGSEGDCTFIVSPLDGKVIRELKTEKVYAPRVSYGADRDASKAAYLAPFEVDGWRGQRGDVGNTHRAVAGQPDTFYVNFTRFVEPEYRPDWQDAEVQGDYGSKVYRGNIIRIFEVDGVLFGELVVGPGRHIRVAKKPGQPWMEATSHPDSPRPMRRYE